MKKKTKDNLKKKTQTQRKTAKKRELNFLIKVTRNGGILAGLYFFSIWAATTELNFLQHIKPILIFLGTYVLTECAKRYKLDPKNPKERDKIKTLIL